MDIDTKAKVNGASIGKVHLEVYALTVVPRGEFDLPTRFFAVFGVDLFRR